MSALGDVIIDALKELLRLLFSPITDLIETYGTELVKSVVSTPHPNAVFDPPTNDPWPAVYAYYWETVVPLSLLLWALAIGLVIFLESTSHLFGRYHRTKLKKRAFSGLLGILGWWWIAAISLRFTAALTGFIVPSLSNISLFETLSFSALGVLGLVVTLAVDLILFVLIAMIYFVRQIVLYLFVLLMPVLIALWVPGVGPFLLPSRLMRQLAGFYVPFLFMTIPVAVLFRLGELIGTGASLSMGGFGTWVTALVLPFIAVASPLVLFWQAGSLFSMADRSAGHLSTSRLTGRLEGATKRGQAATQAGRRLAGTAQRDRVLTHPEQTSLPSRGARQRRVGARGTSSSRFEGFNRSGPGRPSQPVGKPVGDSRNLQSGGSRNRRRSDPNDGANPGGTITDGTSPQE